MARILVVDDDDDHREYVVMVLQRLGHDAASADNGEGALALIADSSFDVMLTDIFMPGIDGIELVKSIRNQGLDLPMIGMTGGYRGVTKPYEKAMSLMAGAQVLRKPFSASELEFALNSTLEG